MSAKQSTCIVINVSLNKKKYKLLFGMEDIQKKKICYINNVMSKAYFYPLEIHRVATGNKMKNSVFCVLY